MVEITAYYYKIVMKNGKEYIVQSEESNIVNFMKSISSHNTTSDFRLVHECNANGYLFNTVFITHDDVSSVEYLIDYKKLVVE